MSTQSLPTCIMYACAPAVYVDLKLNSLFLHQSQPLLSTPLLYIVSPNEGSPCMFSVHLSQSFDVSYDRISRFANNLVVIRVCRSPSLQGSDSRSGRVRLLILAKPLCFSCTAASSYAAGILLVTPLGDLVRRRQLLLLIITISMLLTVGLAATKSLIAFEVLCFFIGVSSCAPQVLVPLAADLAPPNRRASAISIVLSGLLLGVLFSRVMSGVVAQYVTWRVVYAAACGLQLASLLSLWLTLPDFPSKAKKGTTYRQILTTMFRLAATEPTLIQVCLVQVGAGTLRSAFDAYT